jgi:hypothetical protein
MVGFVISIINYLNQNSEHAGSTIKVAEKNFQFPILSQTLYGTLKTSNFKILRWHPYIKLGQNTSGAKVSAF